MRERRKALDHFLVAFRGRGDQQYQRHVSIGLKIDPSILTDRLHKKGRKRAEISNVHYEPAELLAHPLPHLRNS